MRYRPAREWKRGRLFVAVAWDRLALPRFYVCADGDDCTTIGFSFGVDGADPALMLDVTLSGTRLGRLVNETYWRARKAIGR